MIFGDLECFKKENFGFFFFFFSFGTWKVMMATKWAILMVIFLGVYFVSIQFFGGFVFLH